MSTGAQNGPVASARGRARRLAFRATTADCPVKGVAANDVPITRNDHEAGSRITEGKKEEEKIKVRHGGPDFAAERSTGRWDQVEKKL